MTFSPLVCAPSFRVLEGVTAPVHGTSTAPCSLSTNDLGLALACPFVVARFPAHRPRCVPSAAAPAEEEVLEDAGFTVQPLVGEPAVADGAAASVGGREGVGRRH